MLKAIHTTVEYTFLKINQYAFSKDGSLTIFNQIRQLLADNPEYVVAATDEHTAFQRASRTKMKQSMMENFLDYIRLGLRRAVNQLIHGVGHASNHACTHARSSSSCCSSIVSAKRISKTLRYFCTKNSILHACWVCADE
jgi:hypothetical protein